MIGLALSIAFILREYRHMLRRGSHIKRKLDAATGTITALTEGQFRRRHLAAAEHDVALKSVRRRATALSPPP